MDNILKLKLIPEKELYYQNDFGVYACITNEDVKLNLNNYGNFVIHGVMPRLLIGREYIAEIQEVTHKRYGKGYEVKSIRQELPVTIESQHAFLRAILAEKYAEAIINEFPNDDQIIEKIKNGTLNYLQIKGIGDYTFKRIQNTVIENLEIQEALSELSKYGITYRIIKKLIDKYGNTPSLIVQKIKENIYILCEIDGLGFKKVDEFALNSGVEPDSPYRISSAIEYILGEEENEGHCWILCEDLIKKATELTKLTPETIQNHLQNLDRSKFYIDDQRIGLLRNYYYEDKIKEYLKELIKIKNNFKVNNLEDKIKKIEEKQGFSFTDEQLNAIKKCIEENVVIISGRAGSGKTTLLKGIINVLSDYSYETCALSGKASQRIIESTGLKSMTIHRLLGFTPDFGFTYNRNSRLEADIVVLDECSMVNSYLFYSLVSAIKDGGKFIIIGDTEQLPPIGAGAILKDLIDSKQIPVVELTQVHRQALKSGILLSANQVRDGLQITQKNEYGQKIIGELKDLILFPTQKGQNIKQYIIDICNKTKNNIDIMDFQVIVPMKTRGELCAKNLNIELQKIFNNNQDEGIERNGYTFKTGDKIIKNGNDYDNGVFNGTLGIIKWIDTKERIAGIEFIGIEKEVVYNYEDLKSIDLAYASTCHKMQGSQFKNVLIAFDFSAYKLLTRQWVYTALTRASKKCVVIFENDAMRYAIANNDIIKRNTFLRELLIENNSD